MAINRIAARHLVAEAALALADGKPAEAMDRSLDAMELGASVGRGAPVFGTLMAAADMAIGARAADRVVSHLSAAEAQRAGQRLDRILRKLPDPAEVQAYERRDTLLSLREALAGRAPFLPTSTLLPDPKANEALDRARLFVYPKSWAYRRLDDYQRAVASELRKPYPARKAPPLPGGQVDDFIGSFTQLSAAFARRDVPLRLLRGQLALREYRVRHGRYPRELGALVRGIVAQLPDDPFSTQPLRYRCSGEAYLLYSIGPDLKDDGGRRIPGFGFELTSKGDLVAGQPSRKGRSIR